MSYILDALKKAESERHLGELPGLHTPSQTALLPVTQNVWRRSRTVGLAALVIAVAVVGALVWQLPRLRDTGAPPPSTVAPAPALTIPPPAMAITNVPASDLPMPPPLPKPAPINTASAAVASHTAPAGLAANREATAPGAQTKQPSAGFPAAVIAAPAAPAADTARVLTIAQLPDALQHELPPLAIGGSMYSDSPAERMLLVDKRLFHEGDEVAPGLVLENLMPKSAILRYKGYRFRIGF